MSVESPPARIVEEVYVRGGLGNKRLIGWEIKRFAEDDIGFIKESVEEKKSTKLTIEKKEIISQLRDEFTKGNTINIDYIQKKNYPNEWGNIKNAADTYKLTGKDKGILSMIIG